MSEASAAVHPMTIGREQSAATQPIRIPARLIGALLATIVVAGGAAYELTPSGENEGLDDITHASFVDHKFIDRSSWQDEADFLTTQRGYEITEAMLVQANQSRVRYDKDGKLVEDIGHTSSKGIRLNVPAPVIGGFTIVQKGQTVESIADDALESVQTLLSLNPQLAGKSINTPLKTGTEVEVSKTHDPSVVLATAGGDINDMSHGDTSLRDHLVATNVATLASGGSIRRGSTAFMPLESNAFYNKHRINPAKVAETFVNDHAFDQPLLASLDKPKPVSAPDAAAPEHAPAGAETVKPFTEQIVQKMFPDADPKDVAVMYPLIMKALQKRHLDDPDMELYTFATIRAETPHAVPIKEYGGDTRPYAPFEGRGYGQITGETHYQNCGIALNLPLLQNPDLLLQPENSAESVAWFIQAHESPLRAALKTHDLVQLRKIYNGVNHQTGLPNGMQPFTEAWNTGWRLTHDS